MPLQEKHLRLLEYEDQLSRSGASDCSLHVAVAPPPTPPRQSNGYRRRYQAPAPTRPASPSKPRLSKRRPHSVSTSASDDFQRREWGSKSSSSSSGCSHRRHSSARRTFGEPERYMRHAPQRDVPQRYAPQRRVPHVSVRSQLDTERVQDRDFQRVCQIVGKKAALRFRTVPECFRNVRVNDCGAVEREQLLELFRSCGLQDEFVDRFLLSLGSDNVDFNELRAIIGPCIQPGFMAHGTSVRYLDPRLGGGPMQQRLELELQDMCELIGQKVRQRYQSIWDCFHFIDIDNDGVLSCREIVDFVQHLQFPRTMGHRFFNILAAAGGTRNDCIDLATFREVLEPYVNPGYETSNSYKHVTERALRTGLVDVNDNQRKLLSERHLNTPLTRPSSAYAREPPTMTASSFRVMGDHSADPGRFGESRHGCRAEVFSTPRGKTMLVPEPPSTPRSNRTWNSHGVASLIGGAEQGSSRWRMLSSRSWHGPLDGHYEVDDVPPRVSWTSPRPPSMPRPQKNGARPVTRGTLRVDGENQGRRVQYKRTQPEASGDWNDDDWRSTDHWQRRRYSRSAQALRRSSSAGPTMTRWDHRNSEAATSPGCGRTHNDSMGRLVYPVDPYGWRTHVYDSQPRGRGARSGHTFHDSQGNLVHSLERPSDV